MRTPERFADLSHPVATGMQVYPGDVGVEFEESLTVARDGVRVTSLHLGSHSGTHIDAPSHSFQGGADIDELDVSRFVGPLKVIDVREAGVKPHDRIELATILDVLHDVDAGDLVVFRTGWSELFGTRAYLEHPFFAPDVAQFLVDRGIELIGVDSLNPDDTPGPDDVTAGGLPFHDIFLGAGGLIVENLTGLGAVTWPDPVLSVLPLKLAGLDGSPVRAVAFG